MGDRPKPVLHVVALHTGGVVSLDARGTLGPRAGPLLRWMAGSLPLSLGPELEQLLDGLGAGRLPDGREISAWWLQGEAPGPSPTGRSADLAIAAAVLLRRARAELAVDLPRPGEDGGGRERWWLTGSAALRHADGDLGAIELDPVTGWEDKVRQLAAAMAGASVRRAVLLYAAMQHELVHEALRRHFTADGAMFQTPSGARIEPVPVSSPDQLAALLTRLFGREDQVSARWRGAFPDSSPAAAAVLARAVELARQEGHGYLGVDHLMRSLLDTGDRGPVFTQLRRLLPERELCDVLVRPTTPPAGLDPTPRLTRLARRLAPGFDVPDLLRTIVDDNSSPLHVIAGLDLVMALPLPDQTDPGRTREAWTVRPPIPAVWLEVLRGPEDGRPLRPNPGDVIGRAGGPAALPLYAGTACHDRGLSRAHAVWRGEGLLEPLKACRYVSGYAPRNAPAGEPIALRAGEVVQLTPFTWLRGRAHDG